MAHGSAPINRTQYAIAQERIRLGIWRVDLDLGRIWSVPRGAWIGAVRKSRGYVYLATPAANGRRLYVVAHRVIWEFATGLTIPDDLEINHANGDKADNRFTNLELTTGSGNCVHAYVAGLRRPTTGILNGLAKLTEEQVAEVRILCARRVPQREIADRFGVSQADVSMIKRGRTWKHLPGADRAKGKLTDGQIAEVLDLLRAGHPQRKIGQRFGVTQGAISWIKKSKAVC